MDKVESELQAAALGVLTPLRQGRGLEIHAAEQLKGALRTAAHAWATASVISKSAANLFVDLACGIEACSYAYSGEEAISVKAFADEVADLVRACVVVP